MKTYYPQKFISSLVILSSISTWLAIPSFSQQQTNKPIVITIGQPNIWSFEQAHYLLARMHRQNLDLQTAELDNLDPNEVNSQRINIIKTLLEAGFKYDEAVRINNNLRRTDKNLTSQSKTELFARRTALQSESIQLAREIAALKIEKAKTTDDAPKAILDAQIEAKTEQKAAVDAQITQVNQEISTVSTVSDDFQSVEGGDGFDDNKLPKSVLDALIKDKLKDSNPSIAASQRLENHVQMQYEIIAKQLTLLRDEVGPGERMVFLELPQSISTVQNEAANRQAQIWWRISGYTKLDKSLQMDFSADKIAGEIIKLDDKIIDNEKKKVILTDNENEIRESIDSLTKILDSLQSQLAEKEADLAAAKKELGEMSAKRASAGGEPPMTEEQVNAESEKIDLKEKSVKDLEKETKQLRTQFNRTKISRAETQMSKREKTYFRANIERVKADLERERAALMSKYEQLKTDAVRRQLRSIRNDADRVLQGGGEDTESVVAETRELMQKNGHLIFSDSQPTKMSPEARTYVNLETAVGSGDIPQFKPRTVRTVDIIPRQNAVNVNDVKETVKATGVVAAFSFLFGFGGNVRYQRQRETFEQNLNQELYTSGFGKGGTDFGWNFYPFAGTKQLASGVRTTYAVAVIPDDAEALTMKARGCYFPRTAYQPTDYDAAKNWNADDKNPKKWGCDEREEVFILPVPGGGSDSGADFYATGVRYAANRSPKDRMTVSIYGRNFSPQTAVMIEGVPLTEAVGLAQSNVESIISKKVKAVCEKDVCGRFERIDSTQIVLTFLVPDGFKGTPRITLIAPGKAIELNKLHLNINGTDDAQLDDLNDMFGKNDAIPAISIENFQIVSPTRAVLTGTGFDKVCAFYINGEKVNSEQTAAAGSSSVRILNFAAGSDESVTVTLVPNNEKSGVISETHPNPFSLKINNASIIALETGDVASNNILTVKLEGAGFHPDLIPDLDATSKRRGARIVNRIVPSAGQMILEIAAPGPVIQITLADADRKNVVSTIIRVPPPEPAPEEKK